MATVGAQAPELRPLGIGEILDVAIKVYTRNAGTLFRLVAIVVVPVQVIGLLIILSTFPDSLAGVQQNPFAPDPNAPVPQFDGEEFAIFFAGNMLAVILGFIAGVLATGACFKAISDAYLGASAEWRSSLRFSARHLHSLLWVGLLTLLATMVGAIFCIAPGVWLWASFAVATPALLTEGTRGTKGLGRSFNLVQGRWWPTFAVLVLAALLAGVVNSIIGGGVGALTFTDLGQNVVLIQTLNAIATAIGSILATPFTAAVVAVLYFDLRVRKEGFDLQLLAQRIGTETPGGPRPALLPPPIPPVHYAGVPAAAAAPDAAPAPGAPLVPPPQYQAPQVNGLSVASLICGLLWIFWLGSFLALGLGYAGKRQIDRSGGTQTGRGMAIAGIVLGWIGVATLAILIIAAVASQ